MSQNETEEPREYKNDGSSSSEDENQSDADDVTEEEEDFDPVDDIAQKRA